MIAVATINSIKLKPSRELNWPRGRHVPIRSIRDRKSRRRPQRTCRCITAPAFLAGHGLSAANRFFRKTCQGYRKRPHCPTARTPSQPWLNLISKARKNIFARITCLVDHWTVSTGGMGPGTRSATRTWCLKTPKSLMVADHHSPCRQTMTLIC